LVLVRLGSGENLIGTIEAGLIGVRQSRSGDVVSLCVTSRGQVIRSSGQLGFGAATAWACLTIGLPVMAVEGDGKGKTMAKAMTMARQGGIDELE